MDTKVLEELGLTTGEVKAYLALLKLGSVSTGPLAKESGVSRSKLYSILDRLEKKGLVGHVEEKGVVRFQGVEPAKIRDYIQKKEEELKELGGKFEGFLPQLEKWKTGAEEVQKVTLYQGFRGTIVVHEHSYLRLKKGEEYYYMGIPSTQTEEQHRYWRKDHERRVREGIRSKALFNRDVPREVLKNRNRYWGCDARYMPQGVQPPAWFMGYKDTVAMCVPTGRVVTVEIINQEIADSFREYFDAIWAKTKPFKG